MLAVVSSKNDFGLPESAMTNILSVFVLSLNICPFKSSSSTFAAGLISNASAIAKMEKLSL